MSCLHIHGLLSVLTTTQRGEEGKCNDPFCGCVEQDSEAEATLPRSQMRQWQDGGLGLLIQGSFLDTRLNAKRGRVRVQNTPQPLFSIPTWHQRSYCPRISRVPPPALNLEEGTIASFTSSLALPDSHPCLRVSVFRMAGKEGSRAVGLAAPSLLPSSYAWTELSQRSAGLSLQVSSPVPRPSGSKASPGLSSSMRGSPCSLRMTLQERRQSLSDE